jgi:uncharacterized RmlC-like cupin family protein
MPSVTPSWRRTAEEQGWAADLTVIRPEGSERIKQDIDGILGVNEMTAPTRRLCLLVTTIGAGEASNAHYHLDHESALYLVSGNAHTFYGDELEHDVVLGPGDFIYIPPFCPHKTYSQSHLKDAVFVTARTDPNEQERVTVVPELDDGRCDSRVVYID